MGAKQGWIWGPIAAILAGSAAASASLGPAPTAGGRFHVTLESRLDPLVINRIHDWTLALTDAAGAPVDGATIGIEAGVPGLGRVMPTAPRVMGEIGPGLYLIEGMKFDMSGRWRLKFTLAAGDTLDGASFDVDVP